MALNIENTRNYLQGFDFKTLFIEELGWNNAKNKNAFPFQTKEGHFYRKAIAELSGATIYEITNDDGTIPDAKVRDTISREIQKINFEHILIFIDKKRTQTIWRWVKKQEKKNLPREHYFSAGQTGDSFIGKLAGLMVDISEIENNITITDVAKKIQNALDVERVTKKFFRDYQQQFIIFIDLIEGIDNEADKRWYASVILNRLMFIYFLQKKMFLDNGNGNYLSDKLSYSKISLGKNKFYDTFLYKLFFEGFAKQENQRNAATNILIGKIKYLNGGLFLEHKIETKYKGKIRINDVAFENLFILFDSYDWSLDDTPGGNDNEINPDVLGYIFEKYINQKAFGAYYTRTEITEYLCEQTVYKLILDAVNEEEMDPELLKKAGLDKLPKAKHYTNIAELLISLDAATCKKLVYGNNAVMPNLSLLDPACGSGAFLVAAMKTLINVYSAILGKIDFLGDKKLSDWKKGIEQGHPSINYYIKKQIITTNLYGVDIMEEATEIAKLRLFLALVASARTVDQLEPLPNIDFNIMSGNSLIGLLRVDSSRFNKHFQPSGNKQPQGKIVKKTTLYNDAVAQTNLFADEHAKSYQQLINEKEAAILSYKNAHELGITDLQALRDSIQKQEAEANKILNELLLEEFTTLGIKYEQVTWDNIKNKEGKPIKRNINQRDIAALEPFHWGYEFSEIFRKMDGFDAIITNPPWETFQPNAREFLMDFSANISLKKMDIKDFNKELENLMKDEDIKIEYLKYNSFYNHTRQYYRFANQYKNQVPIINGKRHGKDINLYKLFLEQTFNLLKDKGYCGIVIPSGIYSDLGSKKLREMLFEKTKVTGLFSLENRKEIFEGVHRSFKFVVLSFEKGFKTKSFPAAFMRHEVYELNDFPSYGASSINIDFIKKQSPESLSISELKNDLDFAIAEKIVAFPFLSEKIGDKWNLEFQREFNMTDDAHLFNKIKSENSLPLYEGKMVWQFSHLYSEPKFWINEKEGRNALLGRQVETEQTLSYQKYRLTYRDISSPTNERTMINTILPPNVFTGNTLYVSKNVIEYADMLNIVSFLNSYINDFVIRQKITSHCNMFYVYQLSVPRLSSIDKWYKPINEKAAKLICITQQFAELWEDVMKTKWNEKVSATQEYERNKLKAELDGIIAHIYGLTEEKFTYILSTFPIVPQSQRQLALEEYKLLAPQFAKAIIQK
jgi:tRNA G10  N-methylase Trm11